MRLARGETVLDGISLGQREGSLERGAAGAWNSLRRRSQLCKDPSKQHSRQREKQSQTGLRQEQAW